MRKLAQMLASAVPVVSGKGHSRTRPRDLSLCLGVKLLGVRADTQAGSMLGFGNKELSRAAVHFYGVEGLEDGSGPPRAVVDLDERSEPVGGRVPLASFIPLIACRLLYNSKAERAVTTPMMWLLREAANQVIASEAAARAFSIRAEEWQDDRFLDEVETVLVQSMPELVSSMSERPDQSFRAELMRGRNGIVWAKIHAPRRGPAFFAAFGLFALIEHTARHAPYERDIVPAMVGLLMLTDLYFDVLDQENWDTLAALATYQEAVATLVLVDDPRSELTARRQRAGIHGIHGPDPWEHDEAR